MSDASIFRKIQNWQSALGLLYMPLREQAEDPKRYILLNGLAGNFCLDFAPEDNTLARRATAWSSDVGHYVAVSDDDVVTVQRWDRNTPTDRYSWSSVVERIHDFHRFLEKDEPDRSKSVVSHVLRVFRTLRATLHEQQDAAHSLEILLCMLACAATRTDRYQLDAQEWGLSSAAVEYSTSIPTASWESLYSDLTGTGRYDVLRPDLELVLRHAAGTLFQEAHIEARLSPNLWLAGLASPAQILASAQPTETGVYFTPPAIARSLAQEAVGAIWSSISPTLTIFDPACGSGELLRECLRLLKLRSYKGHVRVIGFDISASSVAMARFALTSEKRYWPPSQIDVTVQMQNSLSATWPAGVNILIMNPPFQSWQQMDSKTQEAVTTVLGHQLNNKPNLAKAFAIKANEAIATEIGVLAMVAPSSLLEASSERRVRERLAERLHPILVAKLGYQRAFVHAFVDAGLYVGTTCQPSYNDATAILWADPQPVSMSRALRGLRRWRGAEFVPLKEEGFAVYLRKDVGTSGAPWNARSFDAWQSYEAARRSKNTITAHRLFDIKQGVSSPWCKWLRLSSCR
jgi:adenine-specific DNA-methyltransferase